MQNRQCVLRFTCNFISRVNFMQLYGEKIFTQLRKIWTYFQISNHERYSNMSTVEYTNELCSNFFRFPSWCRSFSEPMIAEKLKTTSTGERWTAEPYL